ncbi:MAG: SusC/RagA family TonB-linked outer membrane protein [Bacteroidales bacterium]|nr:SusC/RagA family TonB-linked outer membrane protein [Bacteroidales bacterium]
MRTFNDKRRNLWTYSFCMTIAAVLMVLWTVPTFAQSIEKKISVECDNESLANALKKVEKASGFKILFTYDEVQSYKVNISAKKQPVGKVLQMVLRNTPLKYTVKGKFISVSLAQQFQRSGKGKTRHITGNVQDNHNEPLIGATVRIAGEGIGTLTDANGNFILDIPLGTDLLDISYIGMETKTIDVRSKSIFHVILEESQHLLKEVVVTGYQTLKKENATGAYQKITSKDMEERYTTNIVSNLEGKVPGLVSYKNGKNGDGESTLTIRGIGSFQAKTNPLVVVDGLPIEGGIESINPYEIESITILKDAAAASIYGARASNGVIVVVSKKAVSEKLSVSFNADLDISECQNFDNYHWLNSSQVLNLEKYNFDYIMNNEVGKSTLEGMYALYGELFSPAMQLMMNHYLGTVTDDDYKAQMDTWRRKDYRKEWRNLMLCNKVVQQYNLALRTKGRYLSSSIAIDYKNDNTGNKRQYDKTLVLSYRGDLTVTKWLNFALGLNLNSERSKQHADMYGYSAQNAFQPYLTMYNDDGSLKAMRAMVGLNNPALQDTSLGLKSEDYNLVTESKMNFNKMRTTNIRTFVHANINILPELNLSGQFQYEDNYTKGETYYEPDSYDMRNTYNLFSSQKIHYFPEGGLLNLKTSEGSYYTFRLQANYEKIFAKKHAVEIAAGLEYRQTLVRNVGSDLLGYDDRTQTNSNTKVNFDLMRNLQSSDLGTLYSPTGSQFDDDFYTKEVLHRFHSYYFTGNYTYDSRYSASLSYRVDKTDLFGADPKFRGRPLWSAGLSWNIQNEKFMKLQNWIDVLKLRASYGLTGNIDSSVSSFLTASISTNYVTGDKVGTVNTPPNDHLRWEKTASWNIGVDYSIFNSRLNGSIDWYYKRSSDLLTLTDIDPTRGWVSLNINNGKAVNKGLELQLDAILMQPKSNCLGISVLAGFAYNENKVVAIDHIDDAGYSNLTTLHKGHPVNSLYSVAYGGLTTDENGDQQVQWKKADGTLRTTSIYDNEFEPADVIFSGALDPKYTFSLTPQITYKGFSLSAMLSYYGGHFMRANAEEWSHSGSFTGFSGSENVSYLNYWNSSNKNAYLANGYAANNMLLSSSELAYMDRLVVHADYMKLRNIVLGYNFPASFCQKLGVENIRLRVQMNNIVTWVRNSAGVDPEAVNPYTGTTLNKTPKSYTMSLSVNF